MSERNEDHLSSFTHGLSYARRRFLDMDTLTSTYPFPFPFLFFHSLSIKNRPIRKEKKNIVTGSMRNAPSCTSMSTLVGVSLEKKKKKKPSLLRQCKTTSPCLRQIAICRPLRILFSFQVLSLNQTLDALLYHVHIWQKPRCQLLNHLRDKLLMTEFFALSDRTKVSRVHLLLSITHRV